MQVIIKTGKLIKTDTLYKGTNFSTKEVWKNKRILIKNNQLLKKSNFIDYRYRRFIKINKMNKN